MRKLLMLGVLLPALMAMRGAAGTAAGLKDEAKIVHMVYFTLKDESPAGKGKLVEACKKYLTKHPGEISFHVGTRATGFTWSVNDLNFDVSLIIIFENRGAHDRYEEAPRHKQFIEENKANWKKVRVFDSVLVR